MDISAQIAERIIKAQENVVGPIALEQASKVPGLKINWPKHEIILEGNQKDILENLVKQYEHLFGPASVEVCREAIQTIKTQTTKDQLPKILE